MSTFQTSLLQFFQRETLTNFVSSVPKALDSNKWSIAGVTVTATGTLLLARHWYSKYVQDKIIFDRNIPFNYDIPSVSDYQKRKHLSYPTAYMNAWYHLCDSNQLKEGQVLVRCINLVV